MCKIWPLRSILLPRQSKIGPMCTTLLLPKVPKIPESWSLVIIYPNSGEFLLKIEEYCKMQVSEVPILISII